MKKADLETFREYAQRWREKASQVQPLMSEKEIVRVFVKTLDGAYFEKLLGCVTNRFSDVVIAREQVEDAIKEGKLSGPSSHQGKSKKLSFQKKEGDVHVINPRNYKNNSHQPTYQSTISPISVFWPYLYPYCLPNFSALHPTSSSSIGTTSHFPINNVSFPNNPHSSQEPTNQAKKEKQKINPIPMTYSQLYDELLKQNLVALDVPQPVSNPPPKWHKPTKTCKYHMGAPGHSIERCLTFKIRVPKLKDAGMLVFEEKKPAGMAVENNPLGKY